MMDQTLLKSHLSLCVPLEIDNLKRQGGPTEWQIEQVQERNAEFHRPDVSEGIFFRLPETRRAITMLIEMLAVLAFQPGGVKFAGLHFDACRHGWMKEVSA